MLVRLTKTKRMKAGWFVALFYLLCVLAPTISYALPGQHLGAPRLTDDGHMSGMMHVHNGAPAQHVHADGKVHQHRAAHQAATPEGDHRATKMESDGKHVPEKAPHSSDGLCCGLMCISAISATLIDIVSPGVPTPLRKIEASREVTDNTPSRLYRPPIT